MQERSQKMPRKERNLIKNAIPRSTPAVIKWSVKIFLEWQNGRKNKNPAVKLCTFTTDKSKMQCLDTDKANMTVESLNFWLIIFFEELCKEDGESCPPRSLYSTLWKMQMVLMQWGWWTRMSTGNYCKFCLSWAVSISFLWYLCIILQVEFTFRHVLDAAIKNLTADGVAWKTTRAEKVGITTDEEKMIWEKGLLRCQMAETLVNTIYFYYGKPFWNSGKGTMATSSKLLIQIVLYLMKVIPKHFMVV